MPTLKKLKVGVIGIRNHAKRLIDQLIISKKVNHVIAFHPTRKVENTKFESTTKFSELLSCDAILISSPTKTHFNYINKLRNYDGYIFVEKPIVNNLIEERKLMNMEDKFLSKIYINYNFIFSNVFTEIKKILFSKSFGEHVFTEITSNHGLAFKKTYLDNWRASSKYGVAELVAVHFLNMIINLFDIKNLEDVKVSSHNHSGNGKAPDTFHIISINQIKNKFSILCSYATPFDISIKIIGTNGIIYYDGKELIFRYPRETYDQNERFKLPSIKKRKLINHAKEWQKSIGRSLDFFLDNVLKRQKFSRKKLVTGLLSMNIIIKNL